MNKLNYLKHAIIGMPIIVAALLYSCTNTQNTTNTQNKNEVVLHTLSDLDMLTPYNGRNETNTYISNQLHQQLMAMDFNSLELIPQLATAPPTVGTNSEGKVTISYEIRPEATWDDNSPITGKDVDFSLKTVLNPLVDCENLRPYLDFVQEVQIDPQNPKKFTVVCNKKYFIAEQSLGDFPIIPAQTYDPNNLMQNFTIKQLQQDATNLKKDPKIIEYANSYNSEKFKREIVSGAGPYKFERWDANQRIVLVKKQNWWGNKINPKPNATFDNYPDKIIYETVNDWATAIVALTGQKLDVVRGIPSKEFSEDLPKSEKFKQNFNAYTPPLMAYDYIAFNNRDPKFKDPNTRKAFAHLMDVDRLIKTVLYGMGERTIGFVHPTKTKFYNTSIQPYQFNVDTAKALLAKANWKDSNGNGIVDKTIDGKLTELSITINFNSGNTRREETCILLKEACKEAGINLNIVPLEFNVMSENMKAHKFEMAVAGWVASTLESDPKQIWHSESVNGGSNYYNYTSTTVDKLIDNLRQELDINKRAEIYKELQKVIYNDVPCIFTVVQKERIAIHKRFENPLTSAARPGYNAGSLKIAQ